jgi:hypothetical protein
MASSSLGTILKLPNIWNLNAAGNEACQLDFGNGALVESFHRVMFLVINDVAILVEHPMEALPLLIGETSVCLETSLIPLYIIQIILKNSCFTPGQFL